MLEDNYTELLENQEGNSIRELIDRYLPYWFWFVLCGIMAVLLAFFYLDHSVSTYKAVASIIIKDEESSSSGLSDYSDLGLFNGIGTNSIANELGLLRSKRLMQNTIEALGLQVKYFDLNEEGEPEVYSDAPFLLEVLSVNEKILSKIRQNDLNYLELSSLEKNNIKILDYASEETKEVLLDSVIEMGYMDFRIKENPNILPSQNEGRNVLIRFDPLETIATIYRSRLGVELIEDNATLIELGIVDASRDKAKDILDQLVIEYNREAIEDKNLIAKNTATFIDERLQIINRELDSVEIGKEEFKEINKLTNIERESSIILESASEYAAKQQEVGTQLGLVNSMIRYLKNKETRLLPSNLGIEKGSINNMIEEFNSLVLERDRILGGATLTNPIVVKLTAKIEKLKDNVTKSLNRERSNLIIARRDLEKQSGIIGSQISEVPAQERLFRSIERQQNVKEALYLFLLKKREENSLSLAATAPKAKIVDKAYSIGGPVSPNPKKIILLSLIIGLSIPFIIINILFILSNKIKTKEDIEKITDKIPVLGQLPHLKKSSSHLIKENDRSILAESFRLLFSDLQYVKGGNIDQNVGYCIFTTSSIKGEGKTFTAANVAMMTAISGKKTILVGADLRNPQLHRYVKGSFKNKGVSDYLASNEIDLSELIKESKLHPNLEILNSGTIPPNPAELLGRKKVNDLFNKLKEEYEYVIVDTAPAMILADTFLINKYADLTLYLIRSARTEKKLVKSLVQANNKGKFSNIGIVLNDVKPKNFGFGGKYEYTYDHETEGKGILSYVKNKIIKYK